LPAPPPIRDCIRPVIFWIAIDRRGPSCLEWWPLLARLPGHCFFLFDHVLSGAGGRSIEGTTVGSGTFAGRSIVAPWHRPADDDRNVGGRRIYQWNGRIGL